ncbi:RNA polymerase sigma factor SigM [Parafrankia colletiae]|uniref:RNA polymerase sigma factor SigM n=1 Tax=Parafrankia colletiae TaxID=573497 RepID=A0A1S1QXQ5_9ACTN|nr:RNA polymerase sigma factor SigM [Parafrankia colletiae]OHV38396.1 RNA polymerase sigma factor SigM [Parafrankia colletiae]
MERAADTARVPAADRAAGVAADAEALRRHVAGDPEAFGELFRAHADRLWTVAFVLLRDAEDAADAVQEAMLSAHRRAADFRGEAAVGTWLHRIVTNAALDRLRRRAVRPTVPLPSSPDGVPYEPVDARDAIAEHDTRMDIRTALALLPDTLRVPVVLVDVEGRPVAEVAEMLDIPVGTVKSRCARARARLAAHLGHLAPKSAPQPAFGNPGASPSVSDEGRRDARDGSDEGITVPASDLAEAPATTEAPATGRGTAGSGTAGDIAAVDPAAHVSASLATEAAVGPAGSGSPGGTATAASGDAGPPGPAGPISLNEPTDPTDLTAGRPTRRRR